MTPELKEKLLAGLKDGSIGRHYIFKNGQVSSRPGLHPNPDGSVIFKDVETALVFLKPPFDRAEIVHAAKNFRAVTPGRSGDTVNFKCLWPGPTQPYVVKDKFANPLTGHHDLELPVFDHNGDGSISRKENIVPRIEERNGQEITANFRT